MAYYTPLRYPGGKRRLAALVARILDTSGLKDIEYAEPYAGGAAIGLSLLFEERAQRIHLNDLHRPVYAFWHTVLNETTDLCERIQKTKITMAEWRRQRAVYEDTENADLADLGFAALFLNRTNRSGIIRGGVIGGKEQTGKWKLDVRFTKEELINRIRRIGRYSSRIELYQMDAFKFAKQVAAKLGANSFTFYDPPYIENGKGLYLNDYNLDGHRVLAERICRIDRPWVVTYDYSAVKHRLYPGQRRIVYNLKYTAQGRYSGKEAMFLSARLGLPEEWRTGQILITSDRSRYPVYGRIYNMATEPEMEEGPTAAERFIGAVKQIVSKPKESAQPKKKKKKEPAKPKR